MPLTDSSCRACVAELGRTVQPWSMHFSWRPVQNQQVLHIKRFPGVGIPSLAMLGAISAAGLASSIITFLDLSYGVSKGIFEFNEKANDLLEDLQSCKKAIEIIARFCRHIEQKTTITVDGVRTFGPPTELTDNLQLILEEITQTTQKFLDLVGVLQCSNAFINTLQYFRREGKIETLKNDLNQHMTSLQAFLQERQLSEIEEIRYVLEVSA